MEFQSKMGCLRSLYARKQPIFDTFPRPVRGGQVFLPFPFTKRRDRKNSCFEWRSHSKQLFSDFSPSPWRVQGRIGVHPIPLYQAKRPEKWVFWAARPPKTPIFLEFSPSPFRGSGADRWPFSPISPEIETEKMCVLSGAATQNTHFFGFLPFPQEGEGAGGWGFCP
jgi:hypothetical protein